jgi:uncharacterized protein YndB with AHSA1/START domain
MSLENYDWSHFDINYYFPSPLEKVFSAWSTNRGLKSFFIETIEVTNPEGRKKRDEETYQTGDTYSWKWRHEFGVSGAFTKVIPNQLVEFSFGSMVVSVHFKQLSDSTLLRLVQTNIPTTNLGRATSHMNCRICWTFFLTNLKSILVNGTDLRDPLPHRASSFEVGFVPKELT